MDAIKDVSLQDIIKEAHNPDLRIYVGCINPRRPGVLLFSVVLEHMYFKPDTEENEAFNLYLMPWKQMDWMVLSVPKYATEHVQAVANRVGLKISDGVPTIIGKDVLTFPVNSEYVFTLENCKGHPVYEPDVDTDALFAEEDKLMAKVFADGAEFIMTAV